jgi:hypothetical protein
VARAQDGPQGEAGVAPGGGVDRGERAAGEQELAEPDAHAGPAQEGGEAAEAVAHLAHTPSRTDRPRTRSRSSRTLRAAPSVASRSSTCSSARAQTIVSPTPGGL